MTAYATASISTPILNRPDFSSVFHPEGIVLDSSGLLKALEMIALTNTLFKIVKKHFGFPYIYEVTTDAYPVNYPLYVDERFLEFHAEKPVQGNLKPPTVENILDYMKSLIGLPYVWGGNYSQGIEEILRWYPPYKNKKLSQLESINWTMKGVDCSGMLYEATRGFTPRNSSWLASYGNGLVIEGLQEEEIITKLKPLDMIVWQGHVLFVLDEKYTIESRAYRGCVFVTPLLERFKQIKSEDKKHPMDSSCNLEFKEKGFIIRRWCY